MVSGSGDHQTDGFFLFFSNEDIKLELLKNKNLATIFNHLLQSGHISDSPLWKSGRP